MTISYGGKLNIIEKTWDSTIGDGGEYIETPERMKKFFDDIEKVYEKYGLSIEGMLDLPSESTIKKMWKI